jgi:hypothetical protein
MSVRLNVKITINPDSSLLVDETQVIPENSDPNFGLRCEIPIGDNDRWDRNYGPGYTDDNGLRVKVRRATVDGQSVKFHLDHYRRSEYQLIVDSSVDPGQHELNVVYQWPTLSPPQLRRPDNWLRDVLEDSEPPPGASSLPRSLRQRWERWRPLSPLSLFIPGRPPAKPDTRSALSHLPQPAVTLS